MHEAKKKNANWTIRVQCTPIIIRKLSGEQKQGLFGMVHPNYTYRFFKRFIFFACCLTRRIWVTLECFTLQENQYKILTFYNGCKLKEGHVDPR